LINWLIIHKKNPVTNIHLALAHLNRMLFVRHNGHFASHQEVEGPVDRGNAQADDEVVQGEELGMIL
jgi:hypothetical protein